MSEDFYIKVPNTTVSDEANAPLLTDSNQTENFLDNISREANGDVQSGPQVIRKDEEEIINPSGVHWGFMTFVVLGDMFGLGTLSLPADFARLGWAAGIGALALCAAGTVYSGVLFARMAVMVPNAKLFDDFGGKALGVLGRRLVYATVYITIFFEPIIFHLTSTESLMKTFYWTKLSPFASGLIVSAIMVPLSQVRGIEDVSSISILATVGMLLSVVIALVKLLRMDVPDRAPTEWVHRDNPRSYMIAIMDIVFTYGGQANWMRYITGLRVRSHFKYCAAATSAFMTIVYFAMGGVGYWRLGGQFDLTKPVTSILPQDAWTAVMNFGLLLHCIFAYQIILNVWTDMVLHLSDHQAQPTSHPNHPNDEPNEPHHKCLWGLSHRAAWLGVSLVGIALSFIASETVPYFNTVMALIASIGDLTAGYALPAVFCIALMGPRMARLEKIALVGVLVPVSLVVSGVGVYSSMREIVVKVLERA